MKNLQTTKYNMIEALENMQIIREKVHLGFATHNEIEELLEFERIMQETSIEFQSEFWV